MKGKTEIFHCWPNLCSQSVRIKNSSPVVFFFCPVYLCGQVNLNSCSSGGRPSPPLIRCFKPNSSTVHAGVLLNHFEWSIRLEKWCINASPFTFDCQTVILMRHQAEMCHHILKCSSENEGKEIQIKSAQELK